MARIIIVGDGPGGLSAALFLAKRGLEVTVFGQDETAMHAALLRNYLGIPTILGSDFQRVARSQISRFGATLHHQPVTRITPTERGLTVVTGDGTETFADYVILASGKSGTGLAGDLDLRTEGNGVQVDGDYRTTVDRVYAVGRLVRPTRSQAVISAGAGAAAALDILARETGKDVVDWDSPPKEAN